MKNTAFTKFHEDMGARIVEFAGYNMPVTFEGINIEHETVRKGVGVFDVSHMGEFWAKGPKAFEFVQRVTTNDVAKLSDGKVQYRVSLLSPCLRRRPAEGRPQGFGLDCGPGQSLRPWNLPLQQRCPLSPPGQRL